MLSRIFLCAKKEEEEKCLRLRRVIEIGEEKGNEIHCEASDFTKQQQPGEQLLKWTDEEKCFDLELCFHH